MDIKPGEITDILKREISEYDREIDVAETGTVLTFGRWPAYDDGEQNFRQVRWLATQVKTWKKWLWDLTDDQDLRDRGGRYFRVAQDCAVMFPMLEMSGTEKARHIAEPLMVYNVSNRHSCVRTKRPHLKRESLVRVSTEFQLRTHLLIRVARRFTLPRRAMGPVYVDTKGHASNACTGQ